jgi:CO dehydrogenase maturation factor
VKLAISGKGGVGKTTFAALLIKALSEQGKRILAIDADPDANLATALGIYDAQSIVPIADMKDLIKERTGAEIGSVGTFFKLNPKVDDLPEKCSIRIDNIKFMRLGGVKKGGGGCICPASTMLKALVHHILLARDEVVVMDMEAGIEHLARGTAAAMEKLIVVVEPGRRSIETAQNIKRLAREIGLEKVFLVGNKIRGREDQTFLEEHATGFDWLGFLPYDDDIIKADLQGKSPYDLDTRAKEIVRKMVHTFIENDASRQHIHSHEHIHSHSHEHIHGDVAHAHGHIHIHVHDHGHFHFLESPHEGENHSHEHTHGKDHGPHDHEHKTSDSGHDK